MRCGLASAVLALLSLGAGPAMAQASPGPATEPPVDIRDLALICKGTATYTMATGAGGGDGVTFATRAPVTVAEDVDFVMTEGEARITVPRVLRPPFSAQSGRGMQAGWWRVEGLEVTPERISGHWNHAMGFRHTLNIDRRTGSIRFVSSFGGMQSFSGACQLGDAANAPRKF